MLDCEFPQLICRVIINTDQITLGKFDAVVLVDESQRCNSGAKHGVNVLLAVAVIVFAFN